MSQAPLPEDRPEGEIVETRPTPDDGGDPKHDPYAAWRVRSFALFAIGGFFANVGSQMQSVAVGWELYERTGSAMSLGWVGLAQGLPIMLFALIGGQVADRWDRRWLVMGAQLVMIGCSLRLAWISHHWEMLAKVSDAAPVWLVYETLFLNGAARAFGWPAGAALLPLLVSKKTFSNAVTWRSTVFQVAAVSGPAVGGWLIAFHHSATVVYLADAALTLTYFLFITFIRSPRVERSSETPSFGSLTAGFRYLGQNKVVLAAIALDLFAVLLGAADSLLPIFAKDILHVGPQELGWLRAAPAVGAFVMAITIAHQPPFRHAGRALLWAVAGFGVVTIVFGVSHWFWLSMLMLAFSGALDNVSVVIRHSLVQLRTPDAMRGRVSAVNSIFISSSNDLGGFRAGAMAQAFGPVISVVAGGIGTILVALAAAKLWPEIRKLGKLHEEEKRSS